MSGFQPGEDGREKIEVPEHYFQTLGYIVQVAGDPNYVLARRHSRPLSSFFWWWIFESTCKIPNIAKQKHHLHSTRNRSKLGPFQL